MHEVAIYRERAAWARERAAAARDPGTKAAWLELAKQYEHLATDAERRRD
jgi:hypothetical protein